MDTTYIWELWGLMIFRLRENIWTKREWRTILWYWVWVSETNERYRRWIRELLWKWVEILWVIADGRKWLLSSFQSMPVQMCQFHMKAIVRRNIGKNPRLDQHKQLKDIMDMLWKVREGAWKEWVTSWEEVNKDRLKEKNEEWNYIHSKARRSIRSLKYHMKYLFTYKKFKWMPNTSNSCEGKASWIKQKANVHRWTKAWRKKKLIDQYLNWSD
jgi:hypothetical protein